MRRSLVALVVGLAVGCSSSEGDDDDSAGGARGGGAGAGALGGSAGTTPRGGGAGSGGAGATAGTSVNAGSGGSTAGASAAGGSSGRGGSAGSSSGGTAGGAGQTTAGGGGSAGQAAGNGGSAGDDASYLPLPEGSRELNGTVNLVSAEAAAELEAFLYLAEETGFPQSSMPKTLNLFLAHYVEQYDYLYVYTDHELPGALAAGRYEEVNVSANPGTGIDTAFRREGVDTNGRLHGVLALGYSPGLFGPLAHETLHDFANYLDPSFGFGQGLDDPDPVHWGYAGINGELGGFDPDTLECETPAGAHPPDCESFGGGRYRYVVGAFGPYTNGPFQPYAPFENYLMGLVPRSDVPNEIPVFVDGDLLEDSFDQATVTMKLEAASVKTVTVDDIVARHGEVTLRPEAERGFTAAFVVISAAPASDEVLTEVAHWGACWGGRETDVNVASFSGLTGGHGTMDTRLGPRRKATTATP